jgi:two-component system chemotaxis response regulator CheB
MGYRARLVQSPPVHHCRPAVDILFRSAAQFAGAHAVALLLTGMGVDGAAGMKAMQMAGAATFAESEETCVVFGMPQAAIKLGAANQVLPLTRMARAIIEIYSENIKL